MVLDVCLVEVWNPEASVYRLQQLKKHVLSKLM